MQDWLGHPLSCGSQAAAQAYDRAVDCQLHAWPGALDAVQEALRHDPDFALAHALLALLLQAQGQGGAAREAIDAARRAGGACDDRERSQIALLAHIVEGRASQALAAVVEHAQNWPTDALAMSTALGAFGLFAFSGRADHDRQRFEFVRRIARHYDDDNPWILTHLSWVHTEVGMPVVGLTYIECSLALRRANGNAAHVMMHARFESGQPEAALAFVDDWLRQYPNDAMLFGHLHWHAALCEIDLGRTDAAVRRWLGFIVPHLAHALPLLGTTDAASLLWRLDLAGQRSLSWRVARDFAAAAYPDGANVFGELHLALLAAAHRDTPGLAACRARLQRLADAGNEAAPVALHWVAGLDALSAGEVERARAELQACLDQAPCLGGSHAQRTIVDRTLAALRLPLAIENQRL
jgi:tetratricopeptide (TPR) repeat protein